MILYALGYALVTAALAALLRRLRPGWSRTRVTRTVALPVPVALLVAAGATIAYFVLKPVPAGQIDSTGMAVVVIGMTAGGAAIAALLIGLAMALLVYEITDGAAGSSDR